MPEDKWSWNLPRPDDSSGEASRPSSGLTDGSADSAPQQPDQQQPSGARAADQSGDDVRDESAEPTIVRPRRALSGAGAGANGGNTGGNSGVASTSGGAHRDPHDDFGRTVLFTILGTIVPGVGLIAAKRKVAGGIVLGVFLAGLAALLIWALAARDSLIAFAANGENLKMIGVALVIIGAAWVAVVVVSHLSLRGRTLLPAQRLGGSILVALLAFVVAAPMAVAARYSYTSADVVNSVFQKGDQSNSATRPKRSGNPNAADPWAQTPRVNILLLGGDAGADRTGTRTDTVIVASIDTKTGNTTLFSLGRNTARMPFPKDSKLHKYYPNGFTNGDGNNAEFFLNAMYDNVPKTVPKDVLGKTDNLGADALKLSVGEALGLPIDYYALINLGGFKEMINALGGITVNVNEYIPIGGDTDRHILPEDYIAPGPNQHLKGDRALWYARGRYGLDDFNRMDRQRCVINAMIEQANPANVLARYQAIAKAGKDIVRTDIPQEELPALVDLSLRVKAADNVRSIVFRIGEDGFYPANPNFSRMRERVKAALGETKKSGTASPSSTSTPTKKKSSSTATKSPASEDVRNTCAYDTKAAAAATRPPTR